MPNTGWYAYFSRTFRLVSPAKPRIKVKTVKDQTASSSQQDHFDDISVLQRRRPSVPLPRRHTLTHGKRRRNRHQRRTGLLRAQHGSASSSKCFTSPPFRYTSQPLHSLSSRHKVPIRVRPPPRRRGGAIFRKVVAASLRLSGGSRKSQPSHHRFVATSTSDDDRRPLRTKGIIGHKKAYSTGTGHGHSRSISRPRVHPECPMWSSISYPRPQMAEGRYEVSEAGEYTLHRNFPPSAAIPAPLPPSYPSSSIAAYDRQQVNLLRGDKSADPWNLSRIVLPPSISPLVVARTRPLSSDSTKQQKAQGSKGRVTREFSPMAITVPFEQLLSQTSPSGDSTTMTICAETLSSSHATDRQSFGSEHSDGGFGQESQSCYDTLPPFAVLPRKHSQDTAAVKAKGGNCQSIDDDDDAAAVVPRTFLKDRGGGGGGGSGSIYPTSSLFRAHMLTPPRCPTHSSEFEASSQRLRQSGRFPTLGGGGRQWDTLVTLTSPSTDDDQPARRPEVKSSPCKPSSSHSRFPSSHRDHPRHGTSQKSDYASKEVAKRQIDWTTRDTPAKHYTHTTTATTLPSLLLPSSSSLSAASSPKSGQTEIVRRTARGKPRRSPLPPPAIAAAETPPSTSIINEVQRLCLTLSSPSRSAGTSTPTVIEFPTESGEKNLGFGEEEIQQGEGNDDDDDDDDDGRRLHPLPPLWHLTPYRCVTEEILREYQVG